MKNKTRIFTLPRGTHIISADSRIWEIVCHDYPYTKLISGCDTAWVCTASKAVKIKGGYVIYKDNQYGETKV